jgi:hypothetical protein
MTAERKNTLSWLSAAMVVVAVMAGYYLYTGGKTTAAHGTEGKTTAARGTKRKTTAACGIRRKTIAACDTKGKTTAARKLSPYGVITGIIYAEEKSSATINGKIVHEGDTIDGVKVVKIYKDKVEFEENKNSWTQRVRQQPNHAWPKVD